MMFGKNYIGSIHDKIRDTLQCRVPGSYLIGEIKDYLDDQKKPDQQKLKMRLARHTMGHRSSFEKNAKRLGRELAGRVWAQNGSRDGPYRLDTDVSSYWVEQRNPS
eukprot:CAMPEP_0170453872 /NCGR_PEP_ID=MMETSP0123-20130129/2322_1 /TAXON_ID=182087 /ORGANISM="Favella ehrenbergii, Strain Fehren 1" /LENGTH=105 /DNA_ID=CAMNT_0010716415 /DNA_START=148 /DNA_END=465 /DNA_ORIENTATION=-